MRIQTRSSSKHFTITFAAHTPHAISAESIVRSTQISARARIASRSGVGASASVPHRPTTAKRLFDDDSPRMSQLKVLVDHAARRHCVGCRLPSSPVHLYSSSVCSDRTRILTVASVRCARLPLSIKVRVRSEQALEL